MAAPVAPPFTVKEYLALEAVAETKHEYTGGRIVSMAGAELAHNRIAHNVQVVLGNALPDCVTVGSDQRVKVEALNEYFYPDVTMTGLEPAFDEPRPRSLTNPQILIEVLSDSTERYDRGEKSSAYRSIATLTDYVMVSSTRREVEHYQRAAAGWILRTIEQAGTCTLANGVQLDLGMLYRGVLEL